MALSVEPASESEIRDELKSLPEWKHEDGAVVRVLTLTTYRDALKFVQDVGNAAEEANHHPDIIMNYKKVTVRYWTHKINGVSKGDLMMARRVEEIIQRTP